MVADRTLPFSARSKMSHRLPELMVVSFIAMLPPALLFFVGRKHYIQGIAVTGVKG